MKSQDLAKKLLKLLKKEAEVDNVLKDMHKEIGQIKAELFEALQKDGIDSIEMEGIKFIPDVVQDFALEDKFKGKQWDYIPDWFNWLRDIGEDGLIKTKESVHPATRRKFLKEWIDDDNELPDFIKEIFFNDIKYNKSAVKRLANV